MYTINNIFNLAVWWLSSKNLIVFTLKIKSDSPMNKSKLLALFFAVFNMSVANAAMDHSAHGGGGSGKASTASNCEKPHVSNFLPPKLSLLAPGAQFSFRAINVPDPEQQISVTVKNIPVQIVAEFKDPFYDIKAKLPDSLRNTVARINIKVSGKTSHCEAEDGWLVKISE
jgi:hypothetical protein